MKTRPLPRLALLLLVNIAFVPRALSAYPIAPVPLWSLIERADLVVWARVARVELNPPTQAEMESPSDGFRDRDVAVLDVLETWKGARVSEVRVTFTSGMMCPAPPRFVEGRVVLAFLERGETLVRGAREAREMEERGDDAASLEGDGSDDAECEEADEPEEEPSEPEVDSSAQEAESLQRWEAWATGRWFTVGLSYGTLYPDASEVPQFRALVSDAVRLQKGGAVSDRTRREWLLRAAARRATRWQGLYELAPATDALHFFYDRSQRDALEAGLSRAELATLAEGFVREPSVDNTLPMMLALLAGYGGREVDRAAVSAIEAVIGQPRLPWWIGDAMMRTLERFADPDPARRLGLDDPTCDGVITCSRIDPAALPGIWREARRELGIPRVAATQVPARIRGVGGDTPD